MSVVVRIKEVTAQAIQSLYGIEIQPGDVLVNATKPEFEGDYTVVLFAFIKQLKKSPDALGQELGEAIVSANPELFGAYNIIKGFLNLSVSDRYWLPFILEKLCQRQIWFCRLQWAKGNGRIFIAQHE